MSRFSIRNNNKGASLILVIGCVALLTVIGGLILVKTANNREMKEREKKAQEAFYEAESGTQIMVSALETCAQNALKSAYVNMLLQYSNQTDAERQTAFVDYFKTALNDQISGDAETFLKEALGLSSEEYAALNLTVSFGTNDITGENVTNASGKITDVENIRMNGVTFSYVNPSNNTQSTLKTDICLATKVPALDGSMYTETVGCAFTDFALIASGDVGIGTERAVGSGQTAEVNGNMYVNTFHYDHGNPGKVTVTGNAYVQNLILDSSAFGSAPGSSMRTINMDLVTGMNLKLCQGYTITDPADPSITYTNGNIGVTWEPLGIDVTTFNGNYVSSTTPAFDINNFTIEKKDGKIYKKYTLP